MKKIIKTILSLSLIFVCLCFVACGAKKSNIAEKVTLAKTVLGEVEFENSEKVKLKQTDDSCVITGEIEAMSKAQASAYGVQDVTHVVVVKFLFDKERTIDSFEIKGEITKVYSTDKNAKNYVGSISSLLDNEKSEDAFCYLVLSANTKQYTLTSKYSDGTSSVIKINIDATLVTAKAES